MEKGVVREQNEKVNVTDEVAEATTFVLCIDSHTFNFFHLIDDNGVSCQLKQQ